MIHSTDCSDKNVVKITNCSPVTSLRPPPTQKFEFPSGLQIWVPQITPTPRPPPPPPQTHIHKPNNQIFSRRTDIFAYFVITESCSKVIFLHVSVILFTGGRAWWGAYVAGGHACHGGVHGKGCAWQVEACVAGACMAGKMATAAGGMHPTGMHSCSQLVSLLSFELNWRMKLLR